MHLKIQEYIYHSLRLVFLVVELALLICASILVAHGFGNAVLWVVCGVSGVVAFGMMPNILHRGQVVYVFQSMILDAEAGADIPAPLADLKRFQDAHKPSASAEDKAWKTEFKARRSFKQVAGGVGVSRVVLDGVIPLGLVAIWIALLTQ